jgi:hypothetical protein
MLVAWECNRTWAIASVCQGVLDFIFAFLSIFTICADHSIHIAIVTGTRSRATVETAQLPPPHPLLSVSCTSLIHSEPF